MDLSTPPPGVRVGALASISKGVTFLFGYGTYQGMEVPPDMGGYSMTSIIHAAGKANPKILLDNGDVVWGCECWWSAEEIIKRMIETGDLIVVDLAIDDFRAGRIPQVATEEPTGGFWTA